MDNLNKAKIALRDSVPDRDIETIFENNFWDISSPNEELFPIHVLRTLPSDKSCAHEQDFIDAKRLEIVGLIKRKVRINVAMSGNAKEANIGWGRFVLTLKNVSTPNEMEKVYYMAQGFSNFQKDTIAHDATNLRPTSIRIIISLPHFSKFTFSRKMLLKHIFK